MNGPAAMTSTDRRLSLFPLRAVLFPGGFLPLKIFEARYLDLMGQCLRQQQPFGVVCLIEGAEAGEQRGAARFEPVGTLARIDDVDAQQAGILMVRCTGTQRFRLSEEPTQNATGLWSAAADLLPLDETLAPSPELLDTVNALAEAADDLRQRGYEGLPQDLKLDDAGWVANRWCELLPLSLRAQQLLMEVQDPMKRLRQVKLLLQQATAADGGSVPEDPGPATRRH